MGYILKLPYRQAFKLINKARKEKNEKRLFRLYAALYPNFDQKTFMSFEEYLQKCRGTTVKIDNRSREDIMAEIMEIEKKFEASR
jgi:hypothetical protein